MTVKCMDGGNVGVKNPGHGKVVAVISRGGH